MRNSRRLLASARGRRVGASNNRLCTFPRETGPCCGRRQLRRWRPRLAVSGLIIPRLPRAAPIDPTTPTDEPSRPRWLFFDQRTNPGRFARPTIHYCADELATTAYCGR